MVRLADDNHVERSSMSAVVLRDDFLTISLVEEKVKIVEVIEVRVLCDCSKFMLYARN